LIDINCPSEGTSYKGSKLEVMKKLGCLAFRVCDNFVKSAEHARRSGDMLPQETQKFDSLLGQF